MLTAAQQPDVQAYIDRASHVYAFLAKTSDLSPGNPAVNATLHEFVLDTMRERTPTEVAAILNAPSIQRIAPGLRRLLGRAEQEMEHFCAAAMVDGKTQAEPRFSSYSNFLYRGNYEALVAAELHAMKWHGERETVSPGGQSIAFVGAGPLPISAIMLHQRTGLPVTCIDSDEKACRLGRQLILFLAKTAAGHSDIDKAIRFVHTSGEEHDYGMNPVVFIASLVDAKERVFRRIAGTSRFTTMTIVRSAEGLSTLLYCPEDGDQGRYNACLAGKTTPSPEIINTSLVYRLPAGEIDGEVAPAAKDVCRAPQDCFE